MLVEGRFQVFGKDAECIFEQGGVAHEKGSTVEVGEHPFVRVHDEAVGVFHSVGHPAHFGKDQGGAGVCGVHMEKEAVFFTDFTHGPDGVYGGRTSAAEGGNSAHGQVAQAQVLLDSSFQQIRLQGKGFVGGDGHQVLLAIARNFQPFYHRRMYLPGRIDAHPGLPVEARLVYYILRGALPSHEQGYQTGGRSRLLDTAGPVGGQGQHIAQPLHTALLELLRSGGGIPNHTLCAQGSRQHLAQHGGCASAGREVCKKLRVLPVGHARQDDIFEIFKLLRKSLGQLGRRGRELLFDVARLDPGLYRVLGHLLEVVGHPVGKFVRPMAEAAVVHDFFAENKGLSLKKVIDLWQGAARREKRGVFCPREGFLNKNTHHARYTHRSGPYFPGGAGLPRAEELVGRHLGAADFQCAAIGGNGMDVRSTGF